MRLSLQTKLVVVLALVLAPMFGLMTLAVNQWVRPLLEEEIRQSGVTLAQALADEIEASRWMSQGARGEERIEVRIRELLFGQSNVVRFEVWTADRLIATNVEEAPPPGPVRPRMAGWSARPSARIAGGAGSRAWEIGVPVLSAVGARRADRVVANVRLRASLAVVDQLFGLVWKGTAGAALVTLFASIGALSFALRRTIDADRRLRAAESEIASMSQRLHEAHRELMNSEKLAALGQLTARLAHEIGTPLASVGGHVALLREELARAHADPAASARRLDTVESQLRRIEEIVRGYLATTARPPNQRQLVDLPTLVERVLSMVRPRLDSLGVEVQRRFARELGPVRAAPLELEQILLNLMTNALDALAERPAGGRAGPRRLELRSERARGPLGGEGIRLLIGDNGVGMSPDDLARIGDAFFTTKPPGRGTGLGLTISRELARKYGGTVRLESAPGAGTQAWVTLPYEGHLHA